MVTSYPATLGLDKVMQEYLATAVAFLSLVSDIFCPQACLIA